MTKRGAFHEPSWHVVEIEDSTYRLLLDGPDLYDPLPDLMYEGSNLRLTSALEGYLQERVETLESIECAFFLFSSPSLARSLNRLAKQGVRVRVVSTPLDSYHRTRVFLSDVHQRLSKHDIASRIYPYFESEPDLELKVFPHVFVRSQRYKRFERGTAPYSLHTKTILARFRDGSHAEILTSSNLSGADETKDELLIIIERRLRHETTTSRFLADLWEQSAEPSDEYDIFKYGVTTSELPPQTSGSLFTAPFYRDSNGQAERLCNDVIASARERIDVCAEHIAAGAYSLDNAYRIEGGRGKARLDGLVPALRQARARGVKVRFLSQTGADPDRSWPGMRSPSNRRQFEQFISDVRRHDLGPYTVNPACHMKFIVADGVALVTTSNFTPTSFIFLPHVYIPSFSWDPGVSYQGVHSEVGHWTAIPSSDLARALSARFEAISTRADSIHLN